MESTLYVQYLRKYRYVLVGCIVLSSAVFAHPHAWIDVQLQLRWNTQQQVIALEQTWVLDAAISAYLLGIDSQQKTIQTLEDSDLVANAAVRPMVERLGPYQYFTFIQQGDSKIPITKVTQVQGFITTDHRLGLRFTIPFAQPRNVIDDALRFAVFDPTYYTAMLYEKTHVNLALETDADTIMHCTLHEQRPNLDPAYVAYVATLPPTQNNDATIGEAFAVWMEVAC